MSHLTANSVWPIISALPEQEKAKLIDQLKQTLTPIQPQPNRKPTANDKVVEKLGEAWKKGNTAMLAADIMRNH